MLDESVAFLSGVCFHLWQGDPIQHGGQRGEEKWYMAARISEAISLGCGELKQICQALCEGKSKSGSRSRMWAGSRPYGHRRFVMQLLDEGRQGSATPSRAQGLANVCVRLPRTVMVA